MIRRRAGAAAAQKAVGADILFRPCQEADDVLFRAIEINHANRILFGEKQIERGIERILASDITNPRRLLPIRSLFALVLTLVTKI